MMPYTYRPPSGDGAATRSVGRGESEICTCTSSVLLRSTLRRRGAGLAAGGFCLLILLLEYGRDSRQEFLDIDRLVKHGNAHVSGFLCRLDAGVAGQQHARDIRIAFACEFD